MRVVEVRDVSVLVEGLACVGWDALELGEEFEGGVA